MDTSSTTVREARDRYLEANHFDMERYRARWFVTRLAFLPLPFPNPGRLHLHDLHHVATGYSTTLLGEAEISAFELRAGCGTLLIGFLCLGALFFAMFLAPRRVLRSLRVARGLRSLYRDPLPYESLLEMTVLELRARLGIPPEGLKVQ